MQTVDRYVIRRALIVMLGLTVVTIGGSLGYMAIEGWDFFDALYMTTITVSTVGFGEVAPLSPQGRVFTVGLIVVGVGAALYMLAALGELLVEGRIRSLFRRERMSRQIQGRSGHVVVAGYGRFGRAVVEELINAGHRPVVLDEKADLEEELERLDLEYVIGSAAVDDVLLRAGIAKADAIVAAVPSEADNVFVTLAARELNPKIRIHARAETEAGARRLSQAGADSVIAPFQMGGRRIAASILRPAVVDFLEIVAPEGDLSVGIEEIRIEADSPFVGRSVRELEGESQGLRVVAVRPHDGRTLPIPPPGREIEPDDMIIVLGERPALLEMARRAEPRSG